MLKNGIDNRTLNTEIWNECMWAKKGWLDENCLQIEIVSVIDKVSVHKRIRELTGNNAVDKNT